MRLRVKFPQIIWIVIGNGEYKLIVCCTLVLLIIYFHYKLMRRLFWRMFPCVASPPLSIIINFISFHYLFVSYKTVSIYFRRTFWFTNNTVETFYGTIFRSISYFIVSVSSVSSRNISNVLISKEFPLEISHSTPSLLAFFPLPSPYSPHPLSSNPALPTILTIPVCRQWKRANSSRETQAVATTSTFASPSRRPPRHLN